MREGLCFPRGVKFANRSKICPPTPPPAQPHPPHPTLSGVGARIVTLACADDNVAPKPKAHRGQDKTNSREVGGVKSNT